MAEELSVNINEIEVEKVVNRWLVDYYFSLAVAFFKNQQYTDFCAIREVLDDVLVRPIESVDDMTFKIRVLQFLSRINEGEKLDVQFDPDQSKTPLESALKLLESMRTHFQIPQEDFHYASTLLKEMILGIFIKNKIFDKAKDALLLYFPKPGNCKRATFMNLISQKSSTHEVIDQINFLQFKKEMLDFCQRLCPFTVPFLHKAAKGLLEKRIEDQDDGATSFDEQNEPGPSSRRQINTDLSSSRFSVVSSRKFPFIQKLRLEIAYKALAEGVEEKTFSDLEEEVEVEAQGNVCFCLVDPMRGTNQSTEQDALFQRDSTSPMEASPADQPPQTEAEPQTQSGTLPKTLYTVARLVVEPDSQPSSQCTTVTQELEKKTEKPPQMLCPSTKEPNSQQCPITEDEVVIPKRTAPRQNNRTRNRASTSFAKHSSESEEDSPPRNRNQELDAQLHDQTNESSSKSSNISRASSEGEDEQQEHLNVCVTPVKRCHKRRSKLSSNRKQSSVEDDCIIDSSLESSPSVSSRHSVPQKSSTPHKDAKSNAGFLLQWKEKVKNATESKETWIDEDSYFPSTRKRGSSESNISHSGNTKRQKWTDSETERLKEGVKKFGEGNWSKIKAYYAFNNRTNVNLKDRWRTMRKLNLI